MYSEFIANHKVFDAKAMSKQCQQSMIRTLQGLGLPVPFYTKREPWGYKRDGMIYMPVESDLQIFLKSIELFESDQYLLPDVWEWFNSAPVTRQLSFRGYKYMKADRPVFPELKLSPEERITFVYRTTSITSEENGTQEV